MRLDEHRRHPHRQRRARQHGGEFALPAGGGALPARLLHAVGRVEHHRIAGPRHDRQRPKIRHQRVVAEAGAPLCQQNPRVPRPGDLGGDVRHIPRRQKLALLHVHDSPGVAGRHQQIGLPAQERRNLQHIHRLGRRRALCRVMHVGQHRPAEAGAHRGQNIQPLRHAHPAGGLRAGAVRLVEAALVNQPHAGRRARLVQRRRHLHRVAHALDLARPGDQHERQMVADGDAPDRHRPVRDHRVHHTSRDCRTAAAMKARNSGCGAKGFDFSSG